MSIRRIKDVDVLGRLTAVDTDVLPEELRGEFERVLGKAFTTGGWTHRAPWLAMVAKQVVPRTCPD